MWLADARGYNRKEHKMPKQYEAIRDSYLKRGKSLKEAKKLAAMTWNKDHPNNPNPWSREDAQARVKKALSSRRR